jgi:prevent-host-death family protein
MNAETGGASEPFVKKRGRLPRKRIHDILAAMRAISIDELHANTDLWVRKATEQEPIFVTADGKPVAKIVPIPVAELPRPFRTRKLIPGYEAIMHKRYSGAGTTEIVSDMRDGK